MRSVVQAVALLALLVPAGLRAQAGDESPTCRATLEDQDLTTAIHFSNGYIVEAPWRITGNQNASLQNGRAGVVMSAVLDRIIETDPASGQRLTTPFDQPIETTFEGESDEDLVSRAAHVWCLTVLRVQEEGNGAARPAAPPLRS
ncbi:MAG: hypothetical protein HY561_05975 [Gemmatimonadetes bacterium]|nr:hypothetical protein [Gemmatimonadota bacterium]